MINFFNTDCIKFMKSKPDKFWDLAIIDPPYGIGINHNIGRRKGDKPSDYKKVTWDNKPPSKEYFDELIRVSKNQIIWGANHFISLIPYDSPCWICWDKGFSPDVSFASFEMAYTSFKSVSKRIALTSIQNDRIHPTQKPVALYRWLLQNYATLNDKILDTHGGSMSIAIACDMEGYDLDICEIDKEYFDAGVKRFEIYKRQTSLFTPEQMKPKQTKLKLDL